MPWEARLVRPAPFFPPLPILSHKKITFVLEQNNLEQHLAERLGTAQGSVEFTEVLITAALLLNLGGCPPKPALREKALVVLEVIYNSRNVAQVWEIRRQFYKRVGMMG